MVFRVLVLAYLACVPAQFLWNGVCKLRASERTFVHCTITHKFTPLNVLIQTVKCKLGAMYLCVCYKFPSLFEFSNRNGYRSYHK